MTENEFFDNQLKELNEIRDELLRQVNDVELRIERIENLKKAKSVAYSREDYEASRKEEEAPF